MPASPPPTDGAHHTTNVLSGQSPAGAPFQDRAGESLLSGAIDGTAAAASGASGIEPLPIPWSVPVLLLAALSIVGTALRGDVHLGALRQRLPHAFRPHSLPEVDGATPQELADALRMHREAPTKSTHHRLGVALANAGQIDKALEFLEEGIRFHSRDLNARYALGVALLRAGQMERSLAHLHYCIRRHPAYLAMFVGDPQTQGHRSDPRVETFVRSAFRETMERWHMGYQ